MGDPHRTDGTLFRRATADEVAADHAELIASPIVPQLLNSFPEPAMILNEYRQVVLVNENLARMLKSENGKLLALRPGELLDCIHATEGPGGCGTTAFCTQCGAARAIEENLKTRTAQVEDCRITRSTPDGPNSLDLRVWATTLEVNRRFTVFALRDTTDENRRAVMERLFFHDVLNTAGGLKGLIELLPELGPGDLPRLTSLAGCLADELLEEIQAQRDLAAAERGELAVRLRILDAEELLSRVCGLYSHHAVALDKIIAPPQVSGDPLILSDEVLLRRVLGNLVKNALEASQKGQTVQIAFHSHGAPTFSVHNETWMPAAVQLQVFQRSFSTKAATGRGIGTYSVKLLTERYLGGKVAYASSPDRGTTFTITLRGAG